MTEYTPDIGMIRAVWVDSTHDGGTSIAGVQASMDSAGAEFDRFVAQVQADALREAATKFRELSANTVAQTMPHGEYRYITTADWLDVEADSLLNPNPETKEETA